MATKAKSNKSGKTKSAKRLVAIHKISSLLSIICFMVIIVGTLMAGANLFSTAGVLTIIYRSSMVILSISVCTRILVRLWNSFEEMKRGQA